MGAKVDGFVHAMTTIAREFDPAFDATSIELRDSKAGNYLGITLTITATSREQLDELYRTLVHAPHGEGGAVGHPRSACGASPSRGRHQRPGGRLRGGL
jgi:putative lipoic acid-binding regulatory protein